MAKGKGTELANAYVTLIPSLDGAQKAIEADLAKVDVTGAGKKMGKRLGEAAGKAAGDDASDGIERGVERADAKSSGTKLGSKLGSAITDSLKSKLGSSSVTDAIGDVVSDSATEGLGALGDTGAASLGKITTAASIAVAAVAAIGAASFSVASDFDTAGARIEAAVGADAEAAERLKGVGRTLYEDGWGDSMTQLSDSLITAREVLGDLSEEDMSYAVEGAMTLEQAYGSDLSETLRGTRVLMDKFGLSSQEATDLMVAGTQRGLDYTGELGDNLSEYAGRWADAGIGASEYFSLLEAGVDGGAYSLDKAGDFLNEFLTSLTDGRMDEAIGNFSQGTQDTFAAFKTGGATAQDVLDAVVGELAGMPDEYAKAQIASELWSSLGEDNAMSMIESFAGVEDTFSDVSGAAEDASDAISDSFEGKATTAMRKWQSLLEPVGSVLVDIASVGADAIGGLAEGIGDLVSGTSDATERQRDLEAATRDVGSVMADAKAGVGDMSGAIGDIELDVDKAIAKLADLGEEVEQTFADQYVDEAKLDAYLGVIDELANKSNLSVTEQHKLTEAVAGFSKITGESYSVVDGANGKIADQNGELQTNIEKLRESAEAWKERSRAEAYSNVATKYMEAEAEAAYDLEVAEAKLADAQAEVAWAQSVQADTASHTAEEIDRSNKILANPQTFKDIEAMQQSVADLSAAHAAAADNAESAWDMYEIEASEASEATKEAAQGINAALYAMGDGFGETLETMGYDTTDLSLALAEAGVSTEELSAVGRDNIIQLAAAFGDSVDSMVWAIDNYNNVPVQNKDGTVTIDDAELIDGQENVYHWNGTTLVDQNGVAAVEDTSLTDAQGNVWVWNGSKLVPLYTTAQVSGNVPSGQAERAIDDTNAAASEMRSRTVVDNVGGNVATVGKSIWDTANAIGSLNSKNVTVNVFHNTYETLTRSIKTVSSAVSDIFNAAGGMRLNAAGGIAPRYHADGAIATRAVPLDIVGEDGAEAIVPLTNRRYSQPFADVIAEGVALRTGGETDALLRQVVRLLADIYGVIPAGMDQRTFGRSVRKAVGYGL